MIITAKKGKKDLSLEISYLENGRLLISEVGTGKILCMVPLEDKIKAAKIVADRMNKAGLRFDKMTIGFLLLAITGNREVIK